MGKMILGGVVLGGGDNYVAVQTEEPTSKNTKVWVTPTDDNTQHIVQEAPTDGLLYGRKSGTWKKVNVSNLISELNNTQKEETREALGLNKAITDSPSDNNYYSRKNGEWVNSSLVALASNIDDDGKSKFLDIIGVAEGCQVVNHGTNDTSTILSPNKYHIWDEVTSLNLTLPTSSTTTLKVYAFQFTSGAIPTVLNVEGLIGWMVDDFEIESNKVYQCTIMNGYGAIGGIAL